MEFTVFMKPVRTQDGKEFPKYLAKLPLKDGGEVTAQVIFKKGCRPPEDFPCNIVVNKDDISAPTKKYINGDGEVAEKRLLFVSKWRDGSPYVDTSADDLAF